MTPIGWSACNPRQTVVLLSTTTVLQVYNNKTLKASTKGNINAGAATEEVRVQEHNASMRAGDVVLVSRMRAGAIVLVLRSNL